MNNTFQFVPPPKLPLQNNIPNNLGDNSNVLSSDTTSSSGTTTLFHNYPLINNYNKNYTHLNYSPINSNININDSNNYNYFNYNQQSFPNYNNIEQPELTVNNLSSFTKDNNKNTDNIEEQIKRNENNKSFIKNSLLSNYFENDKEWFKKWHNLSDKTQVDEINSYKKIKYMDVFNSLLDVFQNIQKMKEIKNQLEEIDINIPDIHNKEKIDACNILEKKSLKELDKLDNIYAISNWKYKRNKIKKRRINKKKTLRDKEKEKIEIKDKVETEKQAFRDYVIDRKLDIEDDNELNEKKYFDISNLIKKQKKEKNLDLIKCQKLIDMIQKLQKIRNIRRSKDIKKQNISFYDTNIIKIEENIEEISQAINPIKEKKQNKNKKKKKKKVKNKNNTDESSTTSPRLSNTQLNIQPVSQSNTLSIINQRHKLYNNNLFGINKNKIYNYTEKNRKLLKIKCEPYSNVYEYFNHTKLDMKSLIYIRKEWDRYIVKNGGTSIPPHYVKPDPPASIYWSQYLINENKNKN